MAKDEEKTGVAAVIEKLKKIKKKPSDWLFVPRRKKFEACPVMLEDGKSVLVSDGAGGFKPTIIKKAVRVRVTKVRGLDKSGNPMGGYRPAAIGTGEDAWTAEDVLEAFLEMSANPACEVVPYEAREVGKEAKDAEMTLMEERNLRQVAEDKLRALEDGSGKDRARIQELEKMVEDMTKPGKKA